MYRVWDWLAVELGKYAKWVGLAVLVLTVVLGLGIGKLEFASGQDSFLNTSDQIYKDNLAYQTDFGGQAMLVLVTMADGHTVEELLDEDGQAQFAAFHERLTDLTLEEENCDEATNPECRRFPSIVTPMIAIEFSNNLIQSDDGNPATSVFGQALTTALSKETPGTAEADARAVDGLASIQRVQEIPVEERTLDNPDWLHLLLIDNQGEIRRPLLINFPDETHAQIVVRMPGNQQIESDGESATLVEEAGAELSFDNATIVTTGAPVLAARTSWARSSNPTATSSPTRTWSTSTTSRATRWRATRRCCSAASASKR